jgi:hypothetical protein
MAKAASSEELRDGFLQHLEQTKRHVERLEQVFQTIVCLHFFFVQVHEQLISHRLTS